MLTCALTAHAWCGLWRALRHSGTVTAQSRMSNTTENVCFSLSLANIAQHCLPAQFRICNLSSSTKRHFIDSNIR